jgi:hypothetical protein
MSLLFYVIITFTKSMKGQCGRGRPEALSERTKRLICRTAVKEHISGARQLKSVVKTVGTTVSISTIKRILKKNKNLKYGTSNKVRLLTSKQKKDRILWAKHHLNVKTDWKTVIFF